MSGCWQDWDGLEEVADRWEEGIGRTEDLRTSHTLDALGGRRIYLKAVASAAGLHTVIFLYYVFLISPGVFKLAPCQIYKIQIIDFASAALLSCATAKYKVYCFLLSFVIFCGLSAGFRVSQQGACVMHCRRRFFCKCSQFFILRFCISQGVFKYAPCQI